MLAIPESIEFFAIAMRREPHFANIFGHPIVMRSCGPPPYFLVRVTLTADGPYWGWWSPDDGYKKLPIHFICHHRGGVDICFVYGPEVEERRDRGRIVRCNVELVRQLTDEETRMDSKEQVPELKESA